MFQRTKLTRLTALFVLAFVCLNAGGAVCVAYCQSFDPAAEKEHCPLQKFSEHCDKAKDQNNDSTSIHRSESEMDCCPFTISFIASPVESKQIAVDPPISAPVQTTQLSPVFVADRRPTFTGLAYRGPPLDRRIDRLKNCIIRI